MSDLIKPPILDDTGQTIKTKLTAILQALQNAGNVFIPKTQKGAASGVAELDSNSKVPLAQLPAQNNASATTLNNTDLPTGQTIKSYLNSNLNKQYTTSGLTLNANATIVDGGYAKIGSLVIVNLRFTISNTITGGDAICTGLPIPHASWNIVVAYNNKKLDCAINTSNNVGQLFCSNELASGTLIVSATYLSY